VSDLRSIEDMVSDLAHAKTEARRQEEVANVLSSVSVLAAAYEQQKARALASEFKAKAACKAVDEEMALRLAAEASLAEAVGALMDVSDQAPIDFAPNLEWCWCNDGFGPPAGEHQPYCVRASAVLARVGGAGEGG
jgi:hypothetical protein